jgi:adenylate cyclase class 2
MKRRQEIEIKLEIQSLREIKRRLLALGFRVAQPRHFESNTLFDFADLRLWKARCLLRLRREGDSWLLTFKGAPARSRRYKVRKEIETRLEDGLRAEEILECLGLSPAFRYEKFRTVYSLHSRRAQSGKGLLVCDETPIGNYLELEGPRKWIDEVARRLGFATRDYITASYASLYRQRCLARGEEPCDMVFSRKS